MQARLLLGLRTLFVSNSEVAVCQSVADSLNWCLGIGFRDMFWLAESVEIE